jgi:hypothetical protein
MTLLCRDLGVLPRAGGLLDQDSYHVWLLQETLTVLHEKEEKDMEAARAKSAAKARHH